MGGMGDTWHTPERVGGRGRGGGVSVGTGGGEWLRCIVVKAPQVLQRRPVTQLVLVLWRTGDGERGHRPLLVGRAAKCSGLF